MKNSKPIHKDCDLWQFVKDLREDKKRYKAEFKVCIKHKRYGEAFEGAIDADMCEWVADTLEYYLRHGKYK